MKNIDEYKDLMLKFNADEITEKFLNGALLNTKFKFKEEDYPEEVTEGNLAILQGALEDLREIMRLRAVRINEIADEGLKDALYGN